MGPQSDLVRHGPGRHEQCGPLAREFRDVCFQGMDSGFKEDVIAQ